jgi:hypothetical protein
MQNTKEGTDARRGPWVEASLTYPYFHPATRGFSSREWADHELLLLLFRICGVQMLPHEVLVFVTCLSCPSFCISPHFAQ